MAKVSINSTLMEAVAATRVFGAIWEAVESLGEIGKYVEVISITDHPHGHIQGKIVLLGGSDEKENQLRLEDTFVLGAWGSEKEVKKDALSLIPGKIRKMTLQMFKTVSAEYGRLNAQIEKIPPYTNGVRNILLIEDELSIYRNVELALNCVGYNVVLLTHLPITPSHPEFQELIREKLADIDLIIWDDELNGICSANGYIQAVAKKFKKPMIAYGKRNTEMMMRLAGCSHESHKTTEQLVKKAREVLDAFEL